MELFDGFEGWFSIWLASLVVVRGLLRHFGLRVLGVLLLEYGAALRDVLPDEGFLLCSCCGCWSKAAVRGRLLEKVELLVELEVCG